MLSIGAHLAQLGNVLDFCGNIDSKALIRLWVVQGDGAACLHRKGGQGVTYQGGDVGGDGGGKLVVEGVTGYIRCKILNIVVCHFPRNCNAVVNRDFSVAIGDIPPKSFARHQNRTFQLSISGVSSIHNTINVCAKE